MGLPPYESFWAYSKQDWFLKLHSTEQGLSAEELNTKLSGIRRKGSDSFKWKNQVAIFFKQFKNPLILLLLGAIILSLFLGDKTDSFIILGIIISSGALSFIQELKANKVVEKLESLLHTKCRVVRHNQEMDILTSEVLPGDIILFSAGDIVPADCLVIESDELHANESSLSGESYPVRKSSETVAEDASLAKRTNCLWEGSSIISGTGKALAILTGEQTIYGKIARSARETTETEFEKNVNSFGYFLMKATLFLSLLILIFDLVQHKTVVESVLFCLALAVGMAPELLPAIMTIAMSSGAERLLEKKVVIKKLSSIQNFGEVNLICTDKTGTITEGEISVFDVVDSSGKNSQYVRTLAYLNAFFETGYNNPIDISLRKLNPNAIENIQKLGEIPYDFIRKRLSIMISFEGKKKLISKGAFHQVAEVCSKVRMPDESLIDIDKIFPNLEDAYKKYGDEGYRTIAVCEKEIAATESISTSHESEMIFCGFILLSDPIKPQVTEAIGELERLQIQFKIVTGDNLNIARSIGKKIGLTNADILSGEEMRKMNSEALESRVKGVQIFAEIEPQQKEQIIRALKKTYVVAYLGDGINDVSAINAADVGISVNNAVDIAREAADIVLLEKDLDVLVEGVKEGRITFANTLKYIFINTGSTFGNMVSVAAASLLLPFLPMLPKQILLTNFITDFPYLSIAGDEVDEEQILAPGKWDLSMIKKYMVIFGLHSSLFDMITFLVLIHFLKSSESFFQTGWFVESILTELCILFIIRTRKKFFKSNPSKSLLWVSVGAGLLTFILLYSPIAGQFGLVSLPLINLVLMITILIVYIITADILKVWFFRHMFEV